MGLTHHSIGLIRMVMYVHVCYVICLTIKYYNTIKLNIDLNITKLFLIIARLLYIYSN